MNYIKATLFTQVQIIDLLIIAKLSNSQLIVFNICLQATTPPVPALKSA